MLTMFLLLAHSVEKEESWFLRIYTSAWRFAMVSNSKALLIFFLSLIYRLPITFLAYYSLFNLFWSSSCLFLSSSTSLFLLMYSSTSPKSSPILNISSSLLVIVLVTSCHFSNKLCLSSCYFLNYSEVLSSSIWEAWVEVISFSSYCCLRPTSIVNFYIWRFSSLILASSSFRYFWRVTWSSYFWFPVMAHC